MRQGRTFAVIDVGSNSVRLLVARQLSEGAFEVIDEEKYDARLGEHLSDFLSPEGMERGIAALRLVSQVALSHSPSETVVVGTEALRRARNAPDFIRLAEHETGLTLRVLTALEEAEASFLGMVNSTASEEGLVVDIGGGSLELIRFAGRKLVDAQSAPLGALYAVDRYLRTDPPAAKDVRALRKAVRSAFGFGPPSPLLIGVGGAVRNLARMVRTRRQYPLRRLHALSISRQELRLLVRDLLAVPGPQRRRISGVSAARSDTLHAAAVVLDEMMDCAGAESLLISGQGLREGMVWQRMRPNAPVLTDVRSASVAGLALANGIDEHATEPLAELAVQMFDASRDAHGLGTEERGLLRFAARLAGIGMHVDYYDRDRHAEYLVHSGDLHGFSHREIVLLAAIVRSAGSGVPDLSPYRAIVGTGDTRRASVLAALLGAAAAVRRRPRSPITQVEASLAHNVFHIELRGAARLDAEVISLERQARRLEALLDVALDVSAHEATKIPQGAGLK
jgi:exopolyphosphatase/guanosine-5'-triphosphate,3'-diphosphate pyrophosphatase